MKILYELMSDWISDDHREDSFQTLCSLTVKALTKEINDINSKKICSADYSNFNFSTSPYLEYLPHHESYFEKLMPNMLTTIKKTDKALAREIKKHNISQSVSTYFFVFAGALTLSVLYSLILQQPFNAMDITLPAIAALFGACIMSFHQSNFEILARYSYLEKVALLNGYPTLMAAFLSSEIKDPESTTAQSIKDWFFKEKAPACLKKDTRWLNGFLWYLSQSNYLSAIPTFVEKSDDETSKRDVESTALYDYLIKLMDEYQYQLNALVLQHFNKNQPSKESMVRDYQNLSYGQYMLGMDSLFEEIKAKGIDVLFKEPTMYVSPALPELSVEDNSTSHQYKRVPSPKLKEQYLNADTEKLSICLAEAERIRHDNLKKHNTSTEVPIKVAVPSHLSSGETLSYEGLNEDLYSFEAYSTEDLYDFEDSLATEDSPPGIYEESLFYPESVEDKKQGYMF